MKRSHVLLAVALAVPALVATWSGCVRDVDRRGTSAPTRDAPADDEEVPPDEPVRDRVTTAAAEETDLDVEYAVSVSVTQPGGVPVAGAQLLVTSRSDAWGARPRAVTEGLTDASGHVEMALPPGRYVLRGMHPDLQIIGAELDVPDDEKIVLRAAPGPRVTMIVRDSDGAPIEGAVAWELHEYAGTVATTGPDGRGDLGRVYPHNPFVLVEAPGYARWSNYVFGTWDGRDAYEYSVTLRPATEVDVLVQEHDGSPAAGATLRCDGSTTACDATGRGIVRVSNFDKEPWLRAEHADGREVHVALTAAPTDGEPVVVQLPGPEPLHGRVKHAWTDQPVPGVRVLVAPDSDTEYTLSADTNDAGEFEIPHVTRDVKIVAFAPGLARTGEDWADIEPDEDGTYTVVVAQTMRVSGRVVDKRGEPLAGARLSVVTWGEPAPMAATPRALTSAPDGTFEIDGIPAVPDVIVIAEDGRGIGWSGIDLELPPAPDSKHHVGDIVVPDGFDLDVPVTDDDGEPLEAGIVWVRWRVIGQGMPTAHRQVMGGVMDPVDNIPQDGAVAEVTAPGCLKTVRRIDATTERIVADRACVVSGRVARADGSPVPDVWVIIESKDQLYTLEGNHGGAKTKADGTFSFGDVRRARYGLRIQRDEDRARVESDTTELDVRTRRVDVGTITVK